MLLGAIIISVVILEHDRGNMLFVRCALKSTNTFIQLNYVPSHMDERFQWTHG